jgi:excisionase family DNA binding protein
MSPNDIEEEVAGLTAAEILNLRGWISPRRAAPLLHVHYHTVLNWIKTGQIKGEYMGRNYRIPISELRRLAQSPPSDPQARGQHGRSPYLHRVRPTPDPDFDI